MNDAKISEKVSQPSESQVAVAIERYFAFFRAAGDNGLLLGLPRDEGMVKKNTISSGRLAGLRARCPVRVIITCQLQGRSSREK